MTRKKLRRPWVFRGNCHEGYVPAKGRDAHLMVRGNYPERMGCEGKPRASFAEKETDDLQSPGKEASFVFITPDLCVPAGKTGGFCVAVMESMAKGVFGIQQGRSGIITRMRSMQWCNKAPSWKHCPNPPLGRDLEAG